MWLTERVTIPIEVSQEADLGSMVYLLVDESQAEGA